MYCGPQVNLQVFIWPSEQFEFETPDIDIAVSYCFVLHFFAPNGKFVFFACLLLSVFYIRLMRPNKVETGRGLLT